MRPRIDVTRPAAAGERAEALLLFQFDDEAAPRGLDRELAAFVRQEAALSSFAGAKGAILPLHSGPVADRRWVIVVGLGKRTEFGPERLRLAAACAARRAQQLKLAEVTVVPPGVGRGAFGPRARVQAVVEGVLLGGYHFERYITDPDRHRTRFKRIAIASDLPAADVRRGIEHGVAVAEASSLARDLVNEPPGALDPEAFAQAARRHARAAGLKIAVLGPAELRREKMGALLAVAQGSDRPPRVVHVMYRPKGKPRARLAFVGKGVTFDSGGYDLKGSDNMLDMKCDMAGGAAVLAATLAAAKLELPVEIHGVIGLVENLVSGKAFKPGDVVTTRLGKTVEINNTDAEGRLVLADLLDWVRTTVKPEAVVDLATLTGACVVALGPGATGVMTNTQAFAERVLAAAQSAGEKMWQLPLYEDYFDQLKSGIADMHNTGERWGGALTAGLFLREFVPPELPWVHLDIAGPAFASKDHAFWGKGGTGAGVATLVELAQSY